MSNKILVFRINSIFESFGKWKYLYLSAIFIFQKSYAHLNTKLYRITDVTFDKIN